MTDRVELGGRYRDDITGLTGVATGRAEYLHETTGVQIMYADQNGVPASVWVAESRLHPVRTDEPPGFPTNRETP